MSQRYRLKEREVKEVLEKVSVTLGNIDCKPFMRDMEVAKLTPQNEVFLVDGKPLFFDVNDEVFPTLLNKEIIEKLPKLTVNMDAVPHICNGANLMAPGIVKITGDFQAGAIAVVVDQKHSKPIALMKTLYNSHELSGRKKGKMARNIHYVSDRFWKAYK